MKVALPQWRGARRWRRRPPLGALLSFVASTSALAACGGPNRPAIPPHDPSVVAPPEDPFAAPTPSFAALRDESLRYLLDSAPSFGRYLGLHRYDGQVPDYSSAGLTRHIARLGELGDALDAVDAANLSPDEQLDLSLLRTEVRLDLFKLVDLDEWHKRPQFYESIFSVNQYLDRDYAPIEQRAAKLLEHEKRALAQMPNIRANLVGPMSKPVVETAIKIFEGYEEYLLGDVKKQLDGVGSEAFQAELATTNTALARAARALADHLTKVELPRGDESHVLGEARYRRLLSVQEGLDIGLDEFSRMGEENLAKNKAAYQALLPKTTTSRPKAKELLAVATRMSEDAVRFVRERGIVTIPAADLFEVKETPPYQRWNSAFLDMPGPFEPNAKAAFYYITMPDPSWPPQEQEEYIMQYGILTSTTTHEIMPGHFLQGLFLRRAPTDVQKSIEAYSFVEGWAHYVEEMMIEEGFGKNDPQVRLGQLSDALLRNCRFVVSIGVHTRGMTLDEAATRFQRDCFQDKATAREQAVRATFDPGYFAYTLGKLQILDLREEAKRRLGDRFDLHRFHDELLSHGSPPVPLIRDRVLADLGG